ncbi:AraC family transcriptional regulator [Mucilaginibacter sp. CAU 1740]|uniref:helix-turn-helix domain-containing protein n=1 Tax=Mucilaginibacter sp. CAU 1740 TaxID=3140365 RepID=UPI00325BFD85
MKVAVNKTRLIGPPIAKEAFIAEHLFFYLVEGGMQGFYGDQYYTLAAGQYGLVRKNRLGRQTHVQGEGYAEKVIFVFDEVFLRAFQAKHQLTTVNFQTDHAFLSLPANDLIPAFIDSLQPYYDPSGQMDRSFFDVKREELLLILLHIQPELSAIFFDFAAPEKINLEAFMNRNFRFNVSLERFAFMTGRSLSAFKRDFEAIYHQTPSRWLTEKRLREAHYLMTSENKRVSEIYLDLGFESLSHFSVAFKKLFGYRPSGSLPNIPNG